MIGRSGLRCHRGGIRTGVAVHRAERALPAVRSTAAGQGCTDYHLTGKIRALVETSTRQSPLGNALFFVFISPPS